MEWARVNCHIFEFDGEIVAFDVYRGRPFLIDSVQKAILRVRPPFDELHAIQQLGKLFSSEAILSSIQELRDRHLLIPAGESIPEKTSERSYPITSLELNIAEDCNLRCAYCCVGQGGFGADQNSSRKRGIMTWETAQRSVNLLIQESQNAPQLHIRFFGGEPLMNWDVIERCVLYAEEQVGYAGKRMSFSIVTNGTLLDSHIINFMRDHDFWVQVSIDGTERMHDAFRLDVNSKGSYQQATRQIPLLLNTLPRENVHARGTITHSHPNLLEGFAHLRELGFAAPELRPVTGHDSEYAMIAADYIRYNKDADELARRLLQSAPGEAEQYRTLFSPYLSLLTSEAARRPPCGAGRNMIGVSVDGSLLPCSDMVGKRHEALQFGDLTSGVNEEKRQLFLKIVDVDNKVGCRHCWARYICGGACASVELGNEGGLDRNAGFECIWIRHVIELSLWIYVKMRAERPDLFYELFRRDLKVDWEPLARIFSTEP